MSEIEIKKVAEKTLKTAEMCIRDRYTEDGGAEPFIYGEEKSSVASITFTFIKSDKKQEKDDIADDYDFDLITKEELELMFNI